MKKILILLIICLTTISLQAQGRFSFSAEVAVGVGIVRGPGATVAPQFVAQYELGGGFRLGAGAGLRYAFPCFQYITLSDGAHERSFSNEFDIPVFLRLGYGGKRFYANVDAGYAIGALSFLGWGWMPGGKIEPCYNGFFVEPHFGVRLGRHSALALGVLWQQSVVRDYVHVVHGSMDDPSTYSVGSTLTTRKLLTPAITLRYAYMF